MTDDTSYTGFTDDERAAMKAHAAELKRGKGANKAQAELEACLDALAAMPDDDRIIGETLHALVAENTSLSAKTLYGMPAYANADGKVVVFFKPKSKFKVRYSEVGFNEFAWLDDGDIWPTVFAVIAMNDAIADQLKELVVRAVGD